MFFAFILILIQGILVGCHGVIYFLPSFQAVVISKMSKTNRRTLFWAIFTWLSLIFVNYRKTSSTM